MEGILRRRVTLLLACLASSAFAETIRFAVIGDFGIRVQTNGVAEMIRGWQPAFVLTLGDNSYSDGGDGKNGFERDVVPAFAGHIAAGTFFPCLGNHDLKASGSGFQQSRLDAYLLALKPPQGPGLPGAGRYYEFAKGPARFFVINSNTEGPDDRRFTRAQGDWLREAMRGAKETFKIVCFHHPPYNLGKRKSDSEMQWPFKEWGASLVLSGHDHNYQVFERRGLHYVVNGLGGDSVYQVNLHGSIPGVTFVTGFPGDDHTRHYGAIRVEMDDSQMKLVMTTVRKVNQQWQQKEFDPVIITAHPPASAPAYRDLSATVTERSTDVAAWQDFLFEGKWLAEQADGRFGSHTTTATRAYQTQRQLPVTGILDAATRAAAVVDGFIPVERP